jgi:hippurate hydrolase
LLSAAVLACGAARRPGTGQPPTSAAAKQADNPAPADERAAYVDAQLERLTTLYYHLHTHPELSFAEEQTAGRIAAELRSAGIETTERVGGWGVVALLRNGDGPTLMIRTDLDALPVTEKTNLPYASTVRATDGAGGEVGVMHACGHDIHMTCLVAVANYLAAHRDQWRGTVMFIGQPAEERGSGARAMLEDGLFERFPKPDFALALHVSSEMPTGTIGLAGGVVMANVDSVDITLHGRGGHGALPHQTIDPIVQAARLVMDLQTIVSREIDATDPAVVTVGAINAGTKHNIIPDTCHLQLTVRSFSDETRQHILAAIERKAQAAAAASGAPPPTVSLSEGTPCLDNDEGLAERMRVVFARVPAITDVVNVERRPIGEDFSRYGRAGVPVLMFFVGSIDPERMALLSSRGMALPSLHSAEYYPDPESTIRVGATAMIAAALDLVGTN